MRFPVALIPCIILASGANGFSAAPTTMASTKFRSSYSRTSRSPSKLQSASAAIPSDGSFSNTVENTLNYGPGELLLLKLHIYDLSRMRITIIMLTVHSYQNWQSKDQRIRLHLWNMASVLGSIFLVSCHDYLWIVEKTAWRFAG